MRSLEQILDDVPEWCDDEFVDEVEAWLADTSKEPPGGYASLRERLGQHWSNLTAAQQLTRALRTEWKSRGRRRRFTFAAFAYALVDAIREHDRNHAWNLHPCPRCSRPCAVGELCSACENREALA